MVACYINRNVIFSKLTFSTKLLIIVKTELPGIALCLAVGFTCSSALAQDQPVDSSSTLQNKITIELKSVLFEGNTVYSDEQLIEILTPWLGKPLTEDDLIDMRSAITDFYTQRYPTSAAFIPQQSLGDGVLTIQVVEGQLDTINVEGTDNALTEAYVRSRVRRFATIPLETNRLVESLQLLQEGPLFEQVNAELVEGRGPGLSDLNLSLTRTPPWQLSLSVNNNQNPDFGAVGGTVAATNFNLLGAGDRLQTGYTVTEGIDLWNVEYALPFNSLDGQLRVGYQENTVAVVGQFEDLDLSSEASTFFFGVRQPLVQTPTEKFTLSATLDVSKTNSFLEDTPFAFTIGTLASEGESKVRALRLGQEYLRRSSTSAVFVRSQFSFGLDIFDATQNEFDIDGTFFSWLGQAQYEQIISSGIIFSARLATQLSPDALLPIEQLGIGGASSVRGYKPSSRTGDQAIVASTEVQFELLDEEWGAISLSPFVDIGAVWNNGINLEGFDRDVISPNILASAGVGLNYDLGNFSARINLGIPLGESDGTEQNLSFQFLYRPRFRLF